MTFPLIDGAHIDRDPGGRPSDPRLAALDEIAARDVLAKKFADARAAAHAYLPKYAPHIDANTPKDRKNIALRDIARRINDKVNALQSSQ